MIFKVTGIAKEETKYRNMIIFQGWKREDYNIKSSPAISGNQQIMYKIDQLRNSYIHTYLDITHQLIEQIKPERFKISKNNSLWVIASG